MNPHSPPMTTTTERAHPPLRVSPAITAKAILPSRGGGAPNARGVITSSRSAESGNNAQAPGDQTPSGSASVSAGLFMGQRE